MYGQCGRTTLDICREARVVLGGVKASEYVYVTVLPIRADTFCESNRNDNLPVYKALRGTVDICLLLIYTP